MIENVILDLFTDDSDARRYSEIISETGMSTATISKHLKGLVSEGYLNKEIDVESGRYPYPATYKISVKGQALKKREIFKKEIDNSLSHPDYIAIIDLMRFLLNRIIIRAPRNTTIDDYFNLLLEEVNKESTLTLLRGFKKFAEVG